jgi:hypothetical protein
MLTCDEVGLPYSRVNLMKLKMLACGKGNAKKPDMIAAAKERFGLELDENAADALWAAAFAMDNDVFTSGANDN